MLAALQASVESYEQLSRKATAAYRQATDLAPGLSWQNALRAFREELAFYEREHENLIDEAAAVLCLGVNGPFEDVSNAFHWAIVAGAANRRQRLSSYLICRSMIKKARLIISYSLNDKFVATNQREILTWVEQGGSLLIWDEQAKSYEPNELLPGLTLNGPSEERSIVDGHPRAVTIKFADSEHALLGNLKSSKLERPGRVATLNSVRSFDQEWKSLAYSISANKESDFLQNYLRLPGSQTIPRGDVPGGLMPAYQLTGPPWAARADRQFWPLMLERNVGQGKIAIAQLGRWQGDIAEDRQFCQTLAENILGWAQV